MNLKEMTIEVIAYSKAKGFDKWITWENFPKVCTYLHSEVSEAFDWWREQKKIGIVKAEDNIGKELADILIRLIHTAHDLGYDLEAEYKNKMMENWKRPFHHGRKI